MSGGLVARLNAPLRQRADFSEVLAGSWTALPPSELARRPVHLERDTVVALGPIALPATYSYACTYQPVHLRLLLTRLRVRYGLPVKPRHINGFYRRYSGDMAELGKGEILTWTAK